MVASLSPADARAVEDLLAAAEEADGYPSVSEQARLRVGQEAEAKGRSLLVRADGSDPDDAGRPPLAGYGVLESAHPPADDQGPGEEPGCWTLEMAVHPQHRDAAGSIDQALLDAAATEVAAAGARLAVWVRGGTDDNAAWLTARGFEPERRLLQLRAPLPVENGRRAQDRPLDLRPFHPGRDEEPWLAVNRRAFAGHPEQGSWTRADVERRERAPWFDPRGFLIHEIDHRIAAFCWTKVHRTPLVGEIYVIGVDPDFQGRGLGRALTMAGLDHLATRGVPEAMLYVEATNVAALALYRSLGFTEHHRETVYVRPAPAEAGG